MQHRLLASLPLPPNGQTSKSTLDWAIIELFPEEIGYCCEIFLCCWIIFTMSSFLFKEQIQLITCNPEAPILSLTSRWENHFKTGHGIIAVSLDYNTFYHLITAFTEHNCSSKKKKKKKLLLVFTNTDIMKIWWNNSSASNSAFHMDITVKCQIIFSFLYHNLPSPSLPAKQSTPKNCSASDISELWMGQKS